MTENENTTQVSPDSFANNTSQGAHSRGSHARHVVSEPAQETAGQPMLAGEGQTESFEPIQTASAQQDFEQSSNDSGLDTPVTVKPYGQTLDEAYVAAAQDADNYTYYDAQDYPFDPYDSIYGQDADGDSVHGDYVDSVAAERPERPMSQADIKARKSRKKLIVIIVLLIVCIFGLGALTVKLIFHSGDVAQEQSKNQQNLADIAALSNQTTKDASTTKATKTEVPDLTELFGMTKDEAVEHLGHGATITAEREIDGEYYVRAEVTVSLADEPSDTRTGSPTVYLSLGAGNKVVKAGYSVGTALLGYGAVSFSEVINSNHIIEKTVTACGVPLDEGSLQLPDDKSAYTNYADDDTTLKSEMYSFSGAETVDGRTREWESVLYYDYVTANATGSLSDTVRQIYVYLS